ncbi:MULTISPECIES: hypothetical protein [Metabacillus]|nr:MULTISPECIES: hypothetical protein [Metabacillus]MCM3443980.1 hypothetical protein [Metabacillus halosaccharovorans]
MGGEVMSFYEVLALTVISLIIFCGIGYFCYFFRLVDFGLVVIELEKLLN